MGINEIKVPQSRNEAVDLVVNALIGRNNRHSFRDGANVVYLQTLRSLLQQSNEAEQLLADFEAIVKQGATTFATMGFVPVVRTEVNLDNMTLTLIVDNPVSDR